jgi:hypothetical protein
LQPGDPHARPVAGPFDAAAPLGITDLARPNAASPYPTQAEARVTVFLYIEGWYNPYR